MGVVMADTLQTHWLLENRVRLLTLPTHFTTEAFHRYDDDTCLMMDQLAYPLFHVIVDAGEMESFPPLSVCIKMRCIRHAHMGWMLSIGATQNPLMRFFLSMVVSATRIRYKDCDSLDEAVVLLKTHDPALPPLETWSMISLPTK
jgi:hypothetical protein